MQKLLIFLTLLVFLGIGSVGIASAQEWPDGLTRYYGFESSQEFLEGVYNLEAFEGKPIFTTEDSLIGKSGRVSINNNWLIEGNEDTNLGSGKDKSLNFWIWGENIGDGQFQSILWKIDSTFWIRANDENFEFRFVDDPYTGGGIINNFQWYMITIVREGVIASIYVNGNLIATDVSQLSDSTADYSIGVRESGTEDLIGLIDEMSWWDSALRQEDVDFLYNNGEGISYIQSPPCIGDINEDENVNVLDLDILLFYWETNYPNADLNDDGIVDVQDLLLVLSNWGPCDVGGVRAVSPGVEKIILDHFGGKMPREIESFFGPTERLSFSPPSNPLAPFVVALAVLGTAYYLWKNK